MKDAPEEPLWNAPQPIAGPCLHAFIVGVSAYAHLPRPGQAASAEQLEYGLGMSQLTCAARTAFAIYEWLVAAQSLVVPLATCRLLLAPNKKELSTTPALARISNRVARADTKSFLKAAKAWRADAASNPENLTLFYFAGHGVQRLRGDHVMLLEDFGDGVGGKFNNAVDTRTLIDGMAVSSTIPTIARRQLYFIDACRLSADEERSYEEQRATAVFDKPVLDMEDDRIRPLFYTALPGAAAFSVTGDRTLFGKALLACLAGAGTERSSGRYCITDAALIKGLNYHLPRVAKEHGGHQDFRVDGTGKPLVLQYFNGRPPIDLLIEVRPSEKAAQTQIALSDDTAAPPTVIGPPIQPHPYSTRVGAGNYEVTISVAGATQRKLLSFDPPVGSLPVDA